jgi:Protein of unknown function (DUF3617)
MDWSKGESMLTNARILAITLCLTLLSASAIVSAQTPQPGLWETSSKITGGSGEAGQKMTQLQEQMANMSPEQRKAMEQMMSPEAQSARMAQMQKQMASMPPEQRKAMELGMAAMQGMRMNSDGTMAFKMCLTKEMIERNQLTRQEGKCIYSALTSTGNTKKYSFTCTEPASSGEGTFTFQSATAYTGNLKINSVQNGKPQSMVVDNTGKFLSADCGTVKPMPLVQK